MYYKAMKISQRFCVKYIVGNWKMNLTSKEAAKLSREVNEFLMQEHNRHEVVVCPPNIWLSLVSDNIKNHRLCVGAQDCSAFSQGAHTGDVSSDMLADLGCKYIIVGHSERRQNYKETSSVVRQKAEQVYQENMHPIICIGESLEDRNEGHTFDVLHLQLEESVPNVNKEKEIFIAYEPIWAIGSGLQPQEKEIEKVGKFIRETLQNKFMLTKSVKILYGGSVNDKNCYNIVNLKNIDGLLIGGASLKAHTFINIIKQCNEVQ